jgi:hypothetical protein
MKVGYTEFNATPDVCTLCQAVTDNTLLYEESGIKISYTNQCKEVVITVDEGMVKIPNTVFLSMLEKLNGKMSCSNPSGNIEGASDS